MALPPCGMYLHYLQAEGWCILIQPPSYKSDLRASTLVLTQGSRAELRDVQVLQLSEESLVTLSDTNAGKASSSLCLGGFLGPQDRADEKGPLAHRCPGSTLASH